MFQQVYCSTEGVRCPCQHALPSWCAVRITHAGTTAVPECARVRRTALRRSSKTKKSMFFFSLPLSASRKTKLYELPRHSGCCVVQLRDQTPQNVNVFFCSCSSSLPGEGVCVKRTTAPRKGNTDAISPSFLVRLSEEPKFKFPGHAGCAVQLGDKMSQSVTFFFFPLLLIFFPSSSLTMVTTVANSTRPWRSWPA